MKIETNDYITVHHFAELYKGKNGKRVTTQYIYRLIKAEKLPAIEIDGIRFVPKKALK